LTAGQEKEEEKKMEGNRDEAEKCINIATKVLEAGDKEKALKFLYKAEKLYPTDRAKGGPKTTQKQRVPSQEESIRNLQEATLKASQMSRWKGLKEIGNAYAVLSNPAKRQQYDLTGGEEPSSPSQSHGGGFDFHRGFEADITPEDLFNMFFGGGFPSCKRTVHKRKHRSDLIAASSVFDAPFISASFKFLLKDSSSTDLIRT
ncbi:hypothetical protein XENOCAPTIV_030681, partial [Xenoophorus captivus]